MPPFYDYECKACGHRLELFQKMSDKPEYKCPECKRDTFERIISPGGGFIFRGPGFYQTDYKNKK